MVILHIRAEGHQVAVIRTIVLFSGYPYMNTWNFMHIVSSSDLVLTKNQWTTAREAA